MMPLPITDCKHPLWTTNPPLCIHTLLELPSLPELTVTVAKAITKTEPLQMQLQHLTVKVTTSDSES